MRIVKNGLSGPLTEHPIKIDGKTVVTVTTDNNGFAIMKSSLSSTCQTDEFAAELQETIAATLFDHAYGLLEERPSQETCTLLSQKICAQIINALAIGVDALESFILALAEQGFDLSDSRFGAALDTALQAIANNT